MNLRSVLALSISATMCAFSMTASSNNFNNSQPQGWYWYTQEEKEEIEKPIEVKPEPIQKVFVMPKIETKAESEEVKVAKPAVLSTAWLRENYEVMRERAMDNPFNEDGSPSKDALAFGYINKLTLDKAQNFSKATHQAIQMDPILDETNRVPLSTSAVLMFNSLLDKDKQEALKYLTNKTGLWFFFDSTCRYCVHQLEILNSLKKKHDFSILNISVNGQPIEGMKDKWFPDRGHSQMLNLTMTPTLVLVQPPNNFYIISQGMSSVDTIEQKILLAATVKNILPKEIKEKIDPYSKGVVTSEQMKKLQTIQDDLDKDPTMIVDYIRKTLSGE